MKREIIEKRQLLVAEYFLQRLSTREIAKKLIEINLINPVTKKPFSHDIIYNDIKKIKEVWNRVSFEDIAEVKAEHLEELKLVKKVAWENNDFKSLLSAMTHEARILGLYDAIKLNSKVNVSVDVKQSVLDKLNRLNECSYEEIEKK